MNVGRQLLVWVVLLVGAVAGLAGSAEAGKRLVVSPILGAEGAAFSAVVEELAEPGNTLIDAGKWRKALKGPLTAKSMKAAAEALRVDGLITGDSQRRGSGFVLTLEVRETKSGEVVGSTELEVAKLPLSEVDKAALAKFLRGAIKKVAPLREVEVVEEPRVRGADARGADVRRRDRDMASLDELDAREERERERERRRREAEEDDRRARRERDRRDRDRDVDRDRDRERDVDRDREADRDRDTERSRRRRDARDDGEDDAPWVADARDTAAVVRAGLGMSIRRMQFQSDPTLTNPPKGYLGFPVAQVALSAELFPAAKSKDPKSKLRRWGLLLGFDRVLKIESRLQYRDQGGVERTKVIPTEHQAFALGVAHRWLLGKPQTGPVVSAFMRYNQLAFRFDTSQLADLPTGVSFDVPTVEYRYLDPGASARFRVASNMHLLLQGNLVVMLGTGDMQRTDQYGSAKVFGFGGDAAFDFAVTERFFMRAGFRYTRISHTFNGNGDLATGRDGDPADIDVMGARDSFMVGLVTAGFDY